MILQKPEPSFALTQAEFGAVLEAGAGFIRLIPSDRSATYSISVQDFQQHARSYYNSGYGPQLRVSLSKFAKTSKVSRRNAHIDSPAIEQVQDIIKPRVEQMDLFR